MSDEILEELIKQAMEQSGEQISITWQGGEPTLMGLDFYKKVVEYEQKYGYGKIVGNGLQTNGLLLNEEWADFLAEYKFLVGLSLDGPKHIHDKYRLTRNGKGSFDIVYRNAQMLLERGVEVNAMCTLTDYSAQFPEETYEFHKNLGLNYMQFIPILESDDNGYAAKYSVTGEQYGEFLCKTFDLWLKDYQEGKNITSIRHFETVFHRYVGFDAPECVLNKQCGVYVVVEHNGDVYGCDFFVDPEWKLGNIKKQKMINMLNSKKQTAFGLQKTKLPGKCRQCKWLKYCYGGCIKDRVKDKLDQGHCHFCTAYKMFFAHADSTLRQMAKDWKEDQVRAQTNETFDASKYF
jgi:uncharacterized protein